MLYVSIFNRQRQDYKMYYTLFLRSPSPWTICTHGLSMVCCNE